MKNSRFKKFLSLALVAASCFCFPAHAKGGEMRYAISEQALEFIAERCDIVDGKLIARGETDVEAWELMGDFCQELSNVLGIEKLSDAALEAIHVGIAVSYYNSRGNSSRNRCVITHCYEAQDIEASGGLSGSRLDNCFVRSYFNKHIGTNTMVKSVRTFEARKLGEKFRRVAALGKTTALEKFNQLKAAQQA